MNLIDDLINLADYNREPEGTEKIRAASDIVDEMAANLGKPNPDPGHRLPWAKLQQWKLRDDELTIWAGINGHGKSQLTGLIATDLVFARQRVCIASLEMKPEKTLKRMLRQFVGYNPDAEWSQHPNAVAEMRELYSQFSAQCLEMLWIYDQMGTVETGKMIALVRYCARKLGVQHMVIDSLMKCVKGADDYNAQKDFVGELFSIARDHKMHIHLVHHIRKLENEAKVPDKMDLKGAGDITDIADNVAIVWRNKTEPNKRKDGEYDCVLNVCKQRNGNGWEGKVGMYYDNESQQYTEGRGERIDFCARAL